MDNQHIFLLISGNTNRTYWILLNYQPASNVSEYPFRIFWNASWGHPRPRQRQQNLRQRKFCTLRTCLRHGFPRHSPVSSFTIFPASYLPSIKICTPPRFPFFKNHNPIWTAFRQHKKSGEPLPSKKESSPRHPCLINFSLPRINTHKFVQKCNGVAKTIKSAASIFGTRLLKLSFCMQGFPYRQALQPRQPFTSFFIRDIISTLCPASSAPFAKLKTSCAAGRESGRGFF